MGGRARADLVVKSMGVPEEGLMGDGVESKEVPRVEVGDGGKGHGGRLKGSLRIDEDEGGGKG